MFLLGSSPKPPLIGIRLGAARELGVERGFGIFIILLGKYTPACDDQNLVTARSTSDLMFIFGLISRTYFLGLFSPRYFFTAFFNPRLPVSKLCISATHFLLGPLNQVLMLMLTSSQVSFLPRSARFAVP